MLDDLVERLPPAFDMEEIRSRVDEFTPYVMVAIQARGLYLPPRRPFAFKNPLRLASELFLPSPSRPAPEKPTISTQMLL